MLSSKRSEISSLLQVWRKTPLNHKNNVCSLSGQPTFWNQCQSKFHNTLGHFCHFPSKKTPRNPDINLNNSIEATSFVDGAISMDFKGTNFIDSKLLIDIGALIPSGISVSEQFFIESLGGDFNKLKLSNLNSANGASANLSMETVGQLSVRIRFNNLSTIFTDSAVVLKNYPSLL